MNRFVPRVPRSFLLLPVIGMAVLVAGCGSGDGDTASTGAAATGSTVASKTCDVPFADSEELGLPSEYPQPKPEPLTIGLINPSGSTEALAVTYGRAKDRIAELGGEAIELDSELDPDRQVSQFEMLVNRNVDAIGIEAILGPNVLNPLLAKAKAAGIPVIAVDLTFDQKPVPGITSQVWHQRDRLVYQQVKAACENLPPESQIALIGLGIPVSLFEFGGERQRYWAEQFGLEIVDEADAISDSVQAGQEAAAGILARNPDIDGILGYNDEPAIGAALAGRAAGHSDLMTFGINGGSVGTAALGSGRLTATAYLDQEDEGLEFANGLYAAAEGLEVPPIVLTGEPRILEAE